jgi:hypothetical protein
MFLLVWPNKNVLDSPHLQMGLKRKEETNEMLQLKHSCLWCWNLDILQRIRGCLELWCRSKKEKTSWADRVKNEVLHRAKEERNIPSKIKRRKANWICHSLRRNCLQKHVTEGKIERWTEVTGRRRRSRKQLLDYLMETRRYWKLNARFFGKLASEEAMYLSLDRLHADERLCVAHGENVKHV